MTVSDHLNLMFIVTLIAKGYFRTRNVVNATKWHQWIGFGTHTHTHANDSPFKYILYVFVVWTYRMAVKLTYTCASLSVTQHWNEHISMCILLFHIKKEIRVRACKCIQKLQMKNSIPSNPVLNINFVHFHTWIISKVYVKIYCSGSISILNMQFIFVTLKFCKIKWHSVWSWFLSWCYSIRTAQCLYNNISHWLRKVAALDFDDSLLKCQNKDATTAADLSKNK